jgi:hypothetical protein
VARSKTVPFINCICGKRGWSEVEDACKALGKAQTKRNRAGDKSGSRRGIKRESRTYLCPLGDCFHLTEQSRRTFNGYATDAEINHVAATYDLKSLIPAQQVTPKEVAA